MKNKKIVTCGVIILIGIMFVGIIFSNQKNDSIKFKREYESLNGVTNETNGKKYRTISISKENKIIYASAEEIVEKIENKESFAVYFGFAKCPWCRSVVPTLLTVTDDLDLNTVYYVDVYDIRNTLELNDDNKVVETKKGTAAYYKLLDYFSDVLDDYELFDNDKNKIETERKRIYAPNVVSVLAGKVNSMTTGISELQDDPYMEITAEMKKQMYSKIKCTLDCLTEQSTVCVKKNAC